MGIGIGWTLFAALLLGVFALPAKYVKNYKWENTWGSFFLFAMYVVPVGFALIMLKGLLPTYQQVPGNIIAWTIALGFLWGCGFCCWGYGLSMVGLSLGYSVTMGTMALVGSMLPFFLGSSDKIATIGGKMVIAGILVCIGGVAINGIAGIKREKSQGGSDSQAQLPGKRMLAGLLICVLAGVLSAGCNIAFHIGGNIGNIASISHEQYGTPTWMAGLAVWTLIFIGGGISSCGFTLFLLFKNNTWKEFTNEGTGRNLLYTFIMAVLHFGCLFFYGLGGFYIGVLGTSVGFAIFQSGALLVGNSLGIITGEWLEASRNSKRWLFTGLSVLIIGIIIVSIGNALAA
ncbi:MAG: L-rhamnose/proton symporter RhaT [Phycisphaerae bacterium]|nr:L-rhamnose/proton symporter RhaT [Phycisphaerae bacterium]